MKSELSEESQLIELFYDFFLKIIGFVNLGSSTDYVLILIVFIMKIGCYKRIDVLTDELSCIMIFLVFFWYNLLRFRGIFIYF